MIFLAAVSLLMGILTVSADQIDCDTMKSMQLNQVYGTSLDMPFKVRCTQDQPHFVKVRVESEMSFTDIKVQVRINDKPTGTFLTSSNPNYQFACGVQAMESSTSTPKKLMDVRWYNSGRAPINDNNPLTCRVTLIDANGVAWENAEVGLNGQTQRFYNGASTAVATQQRGGNTQNNQRTAAKPTIRLTRPTVKILNSTRRPTGTRLPTNKILNRSRTIRRRQTTKTTTTTTTPTTTVDYDLGPTTIAGKDYAQHCNYNGLLRAVVPHTSCTNFISAYSGIVRSFSTCPVVSGLRYCFNVNKCSCTPCHLTMNCYERLTSGRDYKYEIYDNSNLMVGMIERTDEVRSVGDVSKKTNVKGNLRANIDPIPGQIQQQTGIRRSGEDNDEVNDRHGTLRNILSAILG